MKRREAGSGRDLADIEMPVVRLLEIKEGFDTRERVSVTHPAAAHRLHHVNLAGLFRISPIVGLKNCYTRLQEGKVIAMGN